MRKPLLFFAGMIMLSSCRPGGPDEKRADNGNFPSLESQYARGFMIEKFEHYSLLHVRDPWQGSDGIHMRYVVAGGPEQVPDSLSGLPFIASPVRRIILMSTTHLAMVDKLGMAGTVVGISGRDYVSNPLVREGIAGGQIRDVGPVENLNYELILSLQPDVLISYGVSGDISLMVQRMTELGIPVVLNADYLEYEPLGKSEWLKFLAVLYGKEELADSLFRAIAESYHSLKELARGTVERPAVMTGLPWKGTWYVSGGASFAARYIEDAGGDFLWKENDSREAIPLDMESVYQKASGADFWINSGFAEKMKDIEDVDSRLAKFKPFKEKNIYNNNGRVNQYGGNDFWESGVMNPQIILSDLIKIFHPGLLPDHKLVYYVRLN